MKKLHLILAAENVDILAKAIKLLSGCPDIRIESTEYKDPATQEKMKQLIAKSVSNQNK